MMRKAFTLLEVNLAILVMAGGILSVVVLYSLGFRETSQSTEDVAAAAYADAVLARITMALSDTNLTWQTFNSIQTDPQYGWAGYFDSSKPGEVSEGSVGKAGNVFSTLLGKASASGVSASFPAPPSCLKAAGLVVGHTPNSPVVYVAFRASARSRALLTSPLYYTAVTFQGKLEEGDRNTQN